LDGTFSTDPDHDTLSYQWFDGIASIPFSAQPLVTNAFPVGRHLITLAVSDGLATATASEVAEIITAEDAVGRLIAFVESSPGAQKYKRDLVNELEAARERFQSGAFRDGVSWLMKFQMKVRVQIARQNPEAANLLIGSAQNIIDAQTVTPRLVGWMEAPRGHLRFTVLGETGAAYTIQCSTNLVDWVPISTFTVGKGGSEYTAPAPPSPAGTFYRAVLKE
jgi:hypothetical protein